MHEKYLTPQELIKDDRAKARFRTAQNIGYFLNSVPDLVENYRTSRSRKVNVKDFFNIIEGLEELKQIKKKKQGSQSLQGLP